MHTHTHTHTAQPWLTLEEREWQLLSFSDPPRCTDNTEEFEQHQNGSSGAH